AIAGSMWTGSGRRSRRRWPRPLRRATSHPRPRQKSETTRYSVLSTRYPIDRRSPSTRNRAHGPTTSGVVMNEDQAALAGFNGLARRFPLPNLVLFPHVVQGLHIFEPRYRQLMTDALATDRTISIVLLRPGWEEEYDEKPAIEPVACLGRIVWHEKMSDGR